MEAIGFIKREERFTKRKFGGQDTNEYHFDGLIKAATPFAAEFVKVREQRRMEDADRQKRKKPKLIVDNTEKT